MVEYIYVTKNTCSKRIRILLEGNIVKKVEFLDGGCDGNLKAIPRLVEGMTIEEVEKRIKGIECGRKGTSCADQLARGLREAYESDKKE